MTLASPKVLIVTGLLGCFAPQLDAQSSRDLGDAERLTASQLAGCYVLTAGDWSEAPRSGPSLPPLALRLDTALRSEHTRGFPLVAQVADSLTAQRPRSSAASWRPVGTDSLEVLTWNTMFEAELLYLHPESGGLRGVARRTTDARPVDREGRMLWNVWPWAPVSGRRVDCEDVWPWRVL